MIINPGIEPVDNIPEKNLKEAEDIFGEKKKINYSFSL